MIDPQSGSTPNPLMDGETHCENPRHEAPHREEDLLLVRNSQPSEIEREEDKQHYGRDFDGNVAESGFGYTPTLGWSGEPRRPPLGLVEQPVSKYVV